MYWPSDNKQAQPAFVVSARPANHFLSIVMLGWGSTVWCRGAHGGAADVSYVADRAQVQLFLIFSTQYSYNLRRVSRSTSYYQYCCTTAIVQYTAVVLCFLSESSSLARRQKLSNTNRRLDTAVDV